MTSNTKFEKRTILSGLFWKFSERISAQIVSLIVSIVLARLLTPDDYGAVALILVFITIANVFVSNGFGNALIQKKDTDNLDFSSVFYINIAIAVIIYGIIFFIASPVADFYELPILCPALRVLGIRIIIAAINSIQHAYVSKNMLFKRFFWSTLFGTGLSGIVGIYLAYHGFGLWALVAQYLTNTITDTAVLWFTVRWRPELRCSWIRAKALIKYGWKLLVSGLIDTGYSQLRNLLIGKIYTSSDLAFYNQGDKFPQLLVINVNSSISSVLFPALSKYQDNPEKIKYMTRCAIQISSYVMWPIMFGMMVIAEPFIRLILTEKWISCVPYLQIFCISYGLWPIHTANLQAINAIGRSDLFLKLEIVKKCMGIVALIISMFISPIAIAFSLIVTGVISTFINAYPNIKLLNYQYREQLKDMIPAFILSFITSIIVYPICFFVESDVAVIGLQIILGFIIYMVGSILTKQVGFLFIVHYIKNRKKKV